MFSQTNWKRLRRLDTCLFIVRAWGAVVLGLLLLLGFRLLPLCILSFALLLLSLLVLSTLGLVLLCPLSLSVWLGVPKYERKGLLRQNESQVYKLLIRIKEYLASLLPCGNTPFCGRHPGKGGVQEKQTCVRFLHCGCVLCVHFHAVTFHFLSLAALAAGAKVTSHFWASCLFA